MTVDTKKLLEAIARGESTKAGKQKILDEMADALKTLRDPSISSGFAYSVRNNLFVTNVRILDTNGYEESYTDSCYAIGHDPQVAPGQYLVCKCSAAEIEVLGKFRLERMLAFIAEKAAEQGLVHGPQKPGSSKTPAHKPLDR